MKKTIDDVTKDEWAEFAVAADNLLGAARLMYWLRGGDDDDTSFIDAIEGMTAAFNAVGWHHGTQAEFEANVEEMIDSNLDPYTWRAMKDAKPPEQGPN